MLKKFVNFMAGMALVIATVGPTIAEAQMVPGAQSRPNAPMNAQPGPISVAPETQQLGSDPGFVMLADFVPAGGMPRAARPSTVAEDTPIVSRTDFLRMYPQAGITGYNRIAQSNRNLCERGNEMMDLIIQFDEQFANSDVEYAELMDLYNALPSNIRRSTRVMQITQAASTGALCLLSAGLYCIAAIFSGIGNIFTSATNRRLQLANVRLSLANIKLSRLNIRSNRLTLRLDAFWLDLIVPYCLQIFPGLARVPGAAAATPSGSYSSALPPLNVPNRSQQRPDW